MLITNKNGNHNFYGCRFKLNVFYVHQISILPSIESENDVMHARNFFDGTFHFNPSLTVFGIGDRTTSYNLSRCIIENNFYS